MMISPPTSGSQVISDRMGKPAAFIATPGSRPTRTTTPISMTNAYMASDPVWIFTAWREPSTVSSASPLGTPSISVASPVCQNTRASRISGCTKIASYSSSKYHLFSRNR